MVSRSALSFPVSEAATQEGLPGSSTDLSPRAAPNHPGESGQVRALCFPCQCQASSAWGDWPLSPLLTRPNRFRFTLRLTGSPR
jgi:hypothetical protein